MPIDWASTGAMLSGIGSIGGGIALVCAAILGRKAVADYRREKLTEREIIHAENALTIAYRLEEAISAIRSPVTMGFEGEESREELADKDWFRNLANDRAERAVYANIYYRRMRRYDDDYKEAFSQLPAIKAFFGRESEQALRTIAQARHSVRVYADAYINDRGRDEQHTRTIESHIWEGAMPGEVDPVASKIEESITALESKLIPIIRSDFKPDKTSESIEVV